MLNVDDVLVHFDIFSQYYLKFILITFLLNITESINTNHFIFTVAEVEYRCKDESFDNLTSASNNAPCGKCSEWVYADPNSFIAEFQLTCSDWKRTLVGTLHGIGSMAGLLVIGPCSDKLGRKTTMSAVCFMAGVIGVAKSFSSTYWMFIILEFLGTVFGDISSVLFVYCIEIASQKKRLLSVTLPLMGYSLGFSLLALIAWSVPYWRHMLRVIYGPMLILTALVFFLDESPRWLLSQGKKEEAITILKKIAKVNKVSLDRIDCNSLQHVDKKNTKFSKALKDTITSKVLLQRLIICGIWWIASTFVNLGIQINCVSLQGYKYINFALLTVTDILANIVFLIVLMKYKRKVPLACTFFLASLFCFGLPFIPKNIPWLSISFFMLGKIMTSIYFSITYVYTAELFPTNIRNSVNAFCSSVGRIGDIIAPQTPLLMAYWPGLPSLIFGAVSFLAGVVTLFAPDTSNEDSLPDDVQQAETIGKLNLKGWRGGVNK